MTIRPKSPNPPSGLLASPSSYITSSAIHDLWSAVGGRASEASSQWTFDVLYTLHPTRFLSLPSQRLELLLLL